MNPPTLFDAPLPRPIKDSPPFAPTSESSRLAASKVAPKLGRQQAKLLAWLKEFGPATDDQMLASGLHPNSVRGRRGELFAKGLIRRAGVGVSALGNEADRWEAV